MKDTLIRPHYTPQSIDYHYTSQSADYHYASYRQKNNVPGITNPIEETLRGPSFQQNNPGVDKEASMQQHLDRDCGIREGAQESREQVGTRLHLAPTGSCCPFIIIAPKQARSKPKHQRETLIHSMWHQQSRANLTNWTETQISNA
jgi:hypothetical protein